MAKAAGVQLDGAVLRYWRRIERLTQREAARRADCSTVHYRALESNGAKASLDLLHRLCVLYGVNPEELLANPERHS